MKQLYFLCLGMAVLGACHSPYKQNSVKATVSDTTVSTELGQLFDSYWQDRMRLFPFEATANGDNRYNDLFPIDISDNYRERLKVFYQKYLDAISQFDRNKLEEEDRISYDIFKREMQMSLEGLRFPDNLLPVNQFWSVTLALPQLGSGAGNQPFKTVKDYDNWLHRISHFPSWADTAIANMREGIADSIVLPRVLVLEVIPQLNAMITTTPSKSIFYGPVRNFPKDFSTADKKRLTLAFTKMITGNIAPTYKKLSVFFTREYLPYARASAGYSALPDGNAWYDYYVRYWTTTHLSPDSIYNTGIREVARIRKEMEQIREKTGFKENLKAFLNYVDTAKRFMPFRSPAAVINAFWDIKKREDPMLRKLFYHVPAYKFEIRQTEAYRAEAASAEYDPPAPDGSRPGIFYVPILNARKFNEVGMETLFLHEAIPGHHYQMSLQIEDTTLPAFRRFLWYGAYGEGWALYCESLGEELGLYKDPYQKLGNLSDEMLRSIRLVVDVGLHKKGWTREQAIQYMVDNMLTTKQAAAAEIDRYMAIPGQALSYKIGAMHIRALRNKYQKELGIQFNIAVFHDKILNDGCMPLEILDRKMDDWATRTKASDTTP